MKKTLKASKVSKFHKKRSRNINQLFIVGFLLFVTFVTIYGVVDGWFSFANHKTNSAPLATQTKILAVKNGEAVHLTASSVTKRIGTTLYAMLAYNGSIPGPLIKVKQGSTITVVLKNDTSLPTTLHAHGIRMLNKYDGTMLTQNNVAPGGTFTYKLRFPDPGMYWYHSHTQEYIQQNMGLYGNIWVEPKDTSVLPRVQKEIPLMLSDLLIDDAVLASYSPLNHTLMGRYGNTLLINGEQNINFQINTGNRVRFYLTDVANARPFNISIEQQKLTLIGADDGYYEKRKSVNSVVLGPGERSIVDVTFKQSGVFRILHTTPQTTYILGTITVGKDVPMPMNSAMPSMSTIMGSPTPVPQMTMSDVQETQNVWSDLRMIQAKLWYYQYLHKKADKNLLLTLRTTENMNMNPSMGMNQPTTMPMQVASPTMAMGMSPTAGMNMQTMSAGLQMMQIPSTMPCVGGGGMAMSVMTGECPMQQGPIEWEDNMGAMNQMSDATNVKWIMRDANTGKENQDIKWQFKTGDKIKIHIYNDPHSAHPMQHPIHFHGNEFLILSYNGKPNDNIVWKDTLMIGSGETADILLNVTNPGAWMAHCHISEHLEDGMMLNYTVTGEDKVRLGNM